MTLAVNIAQSGSNNVTFRNKIINGACVIDQRNAGASVTPTSENYTLDRWVSQVSQTSKFSVQQNAGSVTPPVGFKNYLGVTSLSAYTVTSTDYFTVEQRVEGLNTYDLAWGTASAATVTLSFWVRSSLTGTFGGSILNSAQNRSYPFTYTISSANTWEQKSITITGDTSGTWLTTNGVGIRLFFSMGMGSTYSGTSGSWSGSTFFSATGATSVVGTNGATWYITGVQLEAGTTASPFEYRQYGTELALCQRYYYRYTPLLNSVIGRGYNTAGNVVMTRFSFPVTMRANPTSTLYGSWSLVNVATLSISEYDTSGISVSMTVGGSADAYFYASTTAQYFDCSSEL